MWGAGSRPAWEHSRSHTRWSATYVAVGSSSASSSYAIVSHSSPAADVASYAVARLKERGILLSTDGPHDNVIKIKPPMPFSGADADRLVRELDEVLAHDFVRAVSGV